MAKAAVLLASALCFFAVADLAQCHDEAYNITGVVYCDTCRVLFPTRISQSLSNAKVGLTCRRRDNDTVTVKLLTTTNKEGRYNLPVVGNHDDEICEMAVVDSGDAECNEKVADIGKAIIAITGNNGIPSRTRYCNPIGFLKKVALPHCVDVLREMDLVPLP
ncbi:hypothetical protein U1Q18_024276 [Sarracenia purpurea var. burkii]